ncbi:MAG: sodium:solute symporter family protein [Gammaproteobacteria bacterium]|nr:sodium:solute symporter family protein [Gammaproteobacteria bacterium]
MLLWLAILAYLFLQLGIGVWASRRVHGETDYLIAGRKLGLLLVTFSLFSTWFGAETVMGSAAAIAEQGIAGGRADPFGYALCLLAMALLIAYQFRKRGYLTLGDFFRERYGRNVEVAAICIVVPASIAWAAAQLLAFGQVLVVVSDVDLDVALMTATGLVIVYTVLGGFLGDVVTDLVQGSILIVGLVILLVLTVVNAGGIESAIGGIEARQLRFVNPDEGILARFDAWLIPIIGSLVAQEAISRFLGARSATIARRACFTAAGVYLVVGLIPVSIALIGANMGLDIGHRDEFLPLMAKEQMPTALFVIFAGALISAILSTVDSTLLAISSLITHNLIDPIRRRGGNAEGIERSGLGIARLVVVIAGIVAYLVAQEGDTIFSLVEMSSSFGTAGIVVTVLLGLWWRRGGAMAAFLALVAGVATTILGGYFLDLDAPFLTSLAVSLTVFVVAAVVHTDQSVDKPVRAGV